MRPGGLSDAQYQERLRVIQRARDRQREQDLVALMAQPWGQRLAYWLTFELGNLHGPSFASDVKYQTEQHTAFREGRRALARSFITAVQDAAPQQYLAMLADHARERQAELALEHTEQSAGEQIE